MEDDNQDVDLFGLGGLGPDETEGEETASVTAAAEGALPPADIRSRYETAVKNYESFSKDYINQIREARKKVEQQPTEKSRGEYLRGLATALAAPRERDDPRFYERRNLYTFLRDVGEYGAAQSEAEKKAKAERERQIAESKSLEAKYGLQAEANLMKELGPLYRQAMKPAAASRDTRTVDERNAASMGLTMKEYYDYKAGLARKPEKTGPEGEAAQILWATTTLDNPAALASEKDAAKRILEKKEPRDIRSERIKGVKYASEYLSRIKDQSEFTVPDIESAIDQIDKGGVFAAGNISRIIRGVPIIGQKATDLEKTLDSIKARVGFDKMRELKDKSPTGSTGLGAVSNAEQRLLQAVKGSLDEDQSPENLRKNLVRLKDFYQKEAFDLLERESGIQGLSGIDETISSLTEQPATQAAPSAKKKRTITLKSGRTVEVED